VDVPFEDNLGDGALGVVFDGHAGANCGRLTPVQVLEAAPWK
jgi:serine/threonine protein phosphatase PrpC